MIAHPYHFNADPCFLFTADPDPAPHQSDANWRPLVYSTDPPRLYFDTRIFKGVKTLPSRLYCKRPRTSIAPTEPPQILNFDFDSHPDPAFRCNADTASQNNANRWRSRFSTLDMCEVFMRCAFQEATFQVSMRILHLHIDFCQSYGISS
jgi:hypothetical protein